MELNMLPVTGFYDRMLLNIHSHHWKFTEDSIFKRRMIKLKFALSWCFQNIFTLFGTHIEMPYLEMMVTQRCNLRCRGCSNLMPLFKHPKDMPIQPLLDDFEKILQSVDKVHLLKILGGEPFLYKDLPRLIEAAAHSSKVVTIELVTNGLMIPSEEILKSMRHPKITVIISDYSRIVSDKMEEVFATLHRHNIQYQFPPLEAWKDFGGFEARNREKSQNRAMFQACSTCVTFIGGEIFCCPRAGNGAALGLVPKIAGEYVEVRNQNISAIQKDLIAFSKLKVISTCDYCDNPGPEIPVAEQITERA